jgi:glucosylglycerate phosphorylase
MDVVSDHLAALYGPGMAAAVRPKLDELLERWRARLPRVAAPGRRDALPLTERDALLITYADQVREPGSSPLRSLGEFAARHLSGVVSGIHILPFYPWSSDDGFSVKDYYAVDPEFGTWEDIRALGGRFDLMFDAVLNHMSAQGEWFARFIAGDPAYRDFFVSVDGDPDLAQVIRPRALPLLTEFATGAGARKIWTTFSADQVDLNLRNPEVLLALLDVLLFYVGQGARFIRLDAIAFLWKEVGTSCLHLPQTHRTVQLMRAVVEAVAPGTMLVTETNVPHVDNMSYFGDGTNEAHMVYNFALPPLVLHTFASADSRKLTEWAGSLALPGTGVTFFNFLASHDGIGVNPARGILSDAGIDALVRRTIAHGGLISYKQMPDGSRAPYELNINFFDALSNPGVAESQETQVSRCVCAHAIQFALVGLPGIYFHSLFGSRGDPAGAAESGIPRRINRGKNSREALERELAETGSLRAQVFAGLRALLRVRSGCTAFHPAGAQEIICTDPRLFALRRTSPDGREHMLCLQNVSAETVTVVVPSAAVQAGRPWRVVLGRRDALELVDRGVQAALLPYEVLWAGSWPDSTTRR